MHNNLDMYYIVNNLNKYVALNVKFFQIIRKCTAKSGFDQINSKANTFGPLMCNFKMHLKR